MQKNRRVLSVFNESCLDGNVLMSLPDPPVFRGRRPSLPSPKTDVSSDTDGRTFFLRVGLVPTCVSSRLTRFLLLLGPFLPLLVVFSTGPHTSALRFCLSYSCSFYSVYVVFSTVSVLRLLPTADVELRSHRWGHSTTTRSI